MKLLTSPWIRRTAALNVCALGVAMFAAVKIVEISINQPKDLFPESITSLKDGTIILGSVPGGVYKIKPGETEAKPFVAREGNGFTTVLGVFADEIHAAGGVRLHVRATAEQRLERQRSVHPISRRLRRARRVAPRRCLPGACRP